MKHSGSNWVWLFKILLYLIGSTLLCGLLLSVVLTQAAGRAETPQPDWAAPSVMALRRIGPVDSARHEPVFLHNLDCSLIEYRQAATSAMRTGCFTPTAYGLMDSDSDTVIFNGTDEGLPLLPYWPGQVLAPWPQALDLISLNAVSTGGSYISLYKNPLASLQDQRDGLLQLSAKQLTMAPELPLKGPDGKLLVINPQTLAFSGSGSWLVAETLNGSFVRLNLATLDVLPFAPAFGSQGSPALLKSQVSVSDDGRYVAIANTATASFKVYDLAACGGTPSGLQPRNCGSYDYWPFVRQKIAGFQSVRHLRFVNDSLLSFDTQTGIPDSSGIYGLAPTAAITSLIDYLGLGDSYTSGEGAFNYLPGTATADNMCHLSARSYPLLLTRDLFGAMGGHSVACSGAVIRDIGSTSQNYRGQVRNGAPLDKLQNTQPALLNSIMANYLPGYVAQHQFVKRYQPAITTVSVGGDDIGFGDIVQRCVMPRVSRHLSDNDCYNTYEDRLELLKLIDRTVPHWTALYKQLLAEAPGTRLYAIGYPDVADDTGNCALNVHLSKGELKFSKELIEYLNSSIRQAAAKAGVNYVDIGQALVGHRLCETASHNVAVNGLTAGTDAGALGINILGKESYHPNALGQALIEQAILDKTRGLTLPNQAALSGSNSQSLLEAPKTGRVINTVVPDSGLATRLVGSNRIMAIKADGPRDGLKSNTVYAVRLDGPNGLVLGTVRSNDIGDISMDITLPDHVSNGSHVVDITGQNQSGKPVDVTQPIYVAVGDNDADGDNIPNVLDTCPGAINSGQDADHDGIDDTCDSLIGQAQAINISSPAQRYTSVSDSASNNVLSRAASPSNKNSSNGRTRVLGDSTQAFRPATSLKRKNPDKLSKNACGGP